MTSEPVAAPSIKQLLLEVRALSEFRAFVVQRDQLQALPKGDGHPVLVLPGFLAGDIATRPLRRFLRDRGYAAHGWKQGTNLGLRTGLLSRMQTRLRCLGDRYSRTVSIVGWSLGGIYARELAKLHPERVRQVITLGSPTLGDLRANHAWRLYERLNDHKVDAVPLETRIDEPPPVPLTAVYSPSDGIVAPATSMSRGGDLVENVAVPSSHVGLVWNPRVLTIIAERLAQPEGAWRRYAAAATEAADQDMKAPQEPRRPAAA